MKYEVIVPSLTARNSAKSPFNQERCLNLQLTSNGVLFKQLLRKSHKLEFLLQFLNFNVI